MTKFPSKILVRLLTIVIFSLFLSSHASSDGTVIIKDDVTIIKSKDAPQREVTIKLPAVSGLKDDEVHRKIKELLSLKNLFGESLEDIKAEVIEGDIGAQDVDFKVNYNQHYLLDIDIWMETMGAYPSTIDKHRAINLKTGEVLTAAEVFKKPMLKKLLIKVKSLKKAEENDSLDDPHYTDEERDIILDGIERAQAYDLKNLDQFSINEKGLTFLYDYGTFPHAVQALQPLGSYFISFQDLKQFIDPDGPLGVFIK